MDASIRQIISLASTSNAANGERLVTQAFNALQQAFSSSKTNDSIDTCGTDLYVECAEVAYKIKQVKISQECLHMYFNGTPLTNQFLCRAYLCQAQLLAPNSTEDKVNFETSVLYLLKAIDFAKDKTRYHFIVYNASVLYWQMARPFLRQGHKRALYKSLLLVVKALEDINDPDYEWRATLKIALIESFVDAGCMKEASATSQTAAQFTLSKNLTMFKEVLSLQIKHKLVDLAKLAKDVQGMPEYSAFFKLEKLKSLITTNPKKDSAKELEHIATTLCKKALIPKLSNREVRKRSLRDDILNVLDENRPSLLIDVARLCVRMDEVNFAADCLLALKECENLSPGILMEMEFVECEILVKQLGQNEETYLKTAVEVRLAAIKRMEQALQNAVRSGNANIVQGACATQWNLCLPLLQKNLRKHVRLPLNAIAQALEDISSLQVTLRCQVHTELAKCEEAVEQIEAAVKHVNKAIQLDDTGLYHERLSTMLHRLQLSTQLYQTPDRTEDVTAIIIEQARKSSDSGSVQMKRSLLVKAGLALAPDAFQYVLDSENITKAKGITKGLITSLHLLGARAKQWKKCIHKAAGHLKRLGDENDRERARLWVDLVKTARQQNVWDVCRVAATFCLLYDDGRWNMSAKDTTKDSQKEKRSSALPQGPKKIEDNATVGHLTPADEEEKNFDSTLHDADLLRMLAEVHVIYGEAMIHFLSCENLKLNETPIPPSDSRQKPKGYEHKKPEENPEWAEYTDWIYQLNHLATGAFLRSAEIGIELEESWIICSGGAYLWNYNKHLVTGSLYTELISTFEKVLFGMQEIGHASEPTLLVRICDVIAKGLLTLWIPKKTSSGNETEPQITHTATTKGASRTKTALKGNSSDTPATTSALAIEPDGLKDVKRALEVCEYGLQVTNGSNLKDVIPTEVRHQLLSTWVQLKQMIQQQISPQFGTEYEKLPHQCDMTKALVILEMLTLNLNQMMKFVVPEFTEVCDIVEQCNWDDPCVELEVWTRLSKLAHLKKDHLLVVRCTSKALDLKSFVIKKHHNQFDKYEMHKRMVALEMLSYASCILGESLMDISAANPSARRQAMHNYVNSANFGEMAGNCNLVMKACREWWNSALPLISSPLERELLQKPLENLLNCILHSTITFQATNRHEKNTSKSLDAQYSNGTTSSESVNQIGVSLGNPADDRTLRAAMYGSLFQTYADKGQWQEGLAVMDKALHHMPRTKHRLILFKHRVMVKAKLGKNVQMDIAKFKGESEDYVAHMWHKVASCSRNTFEQLQAFQQAIEALHSDGTQWRKFEYLLELASWMYANELQISDSTHLVEWACDILLNMKYEETKEEKQREKSKGKKNRTSRSTAGNVVSEKQDNRSSSKDRKKTPKSPKENPQVEIQSKEEKQERESIVGVEFNNLDIKMENLNSTRQLEGLIRSHVMMAIISGKGTKKHDCYCQLAYGFVMRLWKIALGSAAVVMKKLPKSDKTGVEDSKRLSAKKGIKSTTGPIEKGKRKGSPEAMPASTADWAVYDPPDEIKQAFLLDTSYCAISKQTITCAGMTVFYLLELSDCLRNCALNHLSLPVLSLAGVITENILQSQSWSQLIHIKQIAVCYELHLEMAAQHWEILIDSQFLTTADQSLCRQDLELKRIHEEMALQEETRNRKANSELDAKDPIKKHIDDSCESKAEGPGPITLDGRKIGSVNVGEIWTDKAHELLRLGYYQASRTLLNEALVVAKDNDDERLKAEIYCGLAELAVHEGNNGQALKLLQKAQSIGGDILFWKKNITILVDSLVFNDDPLKQNIESVAKVIERTTKCLSALEKSKPTKKSLIGYAKATLTARSCLLSLTTKSISQHPSILIKLKKAEDILHELGFHRELTSIHKEHAVYLVSCPFSSIELQHKNILDAIHLLQQSLTNMMSICITVIPMENNKQVSLPIHRETMDLQLKLVSALLHAAQVSADEDREALAKENTKGFLQRKVEAYIGKPKENQSKIAENWDAERFMFLQNALTILNVLHTTLPKEDIMRATWLCLIGKALRIVGENYHPDSSDYQWNVPHYLLEQVLQDTDANKTILDTSAAKDNVDSQQYVQPSLKISDTTENSEFSYKILSHATEILTQCVKMALQLQAIDIVSEASIEIVECSAQCDPNLAATYLALHQSAEASSTMRTLVAQSLSNPTLSQFSSLLHQESWLLKNCITTGLHLCTLRKNIQQLLCENFTAWKRMQLATNHLDLLKDFPASFNIVMLQHSKNKNILYCGLLDKPKPSLSTNEGKTKSKDKSSPTPSHSRAFVCRFRVSPDRYNEIMDDTSSFRQRLMSFLLQSEYQNSQCVIRQNMLNQLSKNTNEMVISETVLQEQAMEAMKLKEEFESILNKAEAYLKPATNQIKLKLANVINAQANQHLLNGQSLNELPPEFVIILADYALMDLPLEGLRCFQTPHIDSISRDFSLQLLHQRWFVDPEEAAALAEKNKNEAKSSLKTPKGARDAVKNSRVASGVKAIPLNRELPAGCASINTHSVHYIVDPCDDCYETEKHRPDQVFKKLINFYAQTFTSRWKGCYGTENFPSVGQWEDTFKNCSMFIFFGMERFIAQFPPSKLTALNLDECQLMLLLDKSQTNKSFTNQSKVDVDKTNQLLSIEKPLETAMLLSLCGSKSVCLNQWHTTSMDNSFKLQSLLQDILEKGVTLGQAVRKITNPFLKKPEPLVEDAPLSPVKEKRKDDDKTKKKDSAKRRSPIVAKAPPTDNQDGNFSPLINNNEEDVETKLGAVETQFDKLLEASYCNMVVFGLPNLVVT